MGMAGEVTPSKSHPSQQEWLCHWADWEQTATVSVFQWHINSAEQIWPRLGWAQADTARAFSCCSSNVLQHWLLLLVLLCPFGFGALAAKRLLPGYYLKVAFFCRESSGLAPYCPSASNALYVQPAGDTDYEEWHKGCPGLRDCHINPLKIK